MPNVYFITLNWGGGAVLDVRTITLTEMKMCLKCCVLINFVWTIRDLERFCLTGNLNPMEKIFLLTLRKNNCVVIGKLWVHLTSPMRPRRQSNNDHHDLFIFWPFVHDVTNHVMLKPTPSWSATVDSLHEVPFEDGEFLRCLWVFKPFG